MYNHDVLQLLKNLTSWEEAFKAYELKGNTENLSQQSIFQFLESHFIKESDAQRIYFYQAMIDTPESPVMYA
ncbi:MAG: hypothetical protein LUH07_01560, partial [Lachnospiraceae bacterium]|nr:hypothetical protein [Lachnospiraceae bacterium]